MKFLNALNRLRVKKNTHNFSDAGLTLSSGGTVEGENLIHVVSNQMGMHYESYLKYTLVIVKEVMTNPSHCSTTTAKELIYMQSNNIHKVILMTKFIQHLC